MRHLSKRFSALLMVTALFLALTPIVSAHVTINPSESPVNAYEKYGVRVPVEKDINTTELTLNVPSDVNLISILPVLDWDYDIVTNDDGQITSVTWVANDGGIGPGEFTEFNFIAVNPGEATDLSWEALQTYEDGSVVEWIGPEGSEEPASVTSVVAQSSDDSNSSSSDSSNESSSSTPWLPISLAGVAILLSLISLFRR